MHKWGFEKVPGDRYLLYICEIAVDMQHLIIEERSYQYGYNIDDPLKIPRGPFFIKQPTNMVFDGTKKAVTNDVTLKYVGVKIQKTLFILRGVVVNYMYAFVYQIIAVLLVATQLLRMNGSEKNMIMKTNQSR